MVGFAQSRRACIDLVAEIRARPAYAPVWRARRDVGLGDTLEIDASEIRFRAERLMRQPSRRYRQMVPALGVFGGDWRSRDLHCRQCAVTIKLHKFRDGGWISSLIHTIHRMARQTRM
jgi:hypothetical protein